MKKKRPAPPATRPSRRVRWEMEILPSAMIVGLLVGFGVELYTHIISVVWMTGGALLGGLVGAICDTALFIYRRIRQQRMQATTTAGPA